MTAIGVIVARAGSKRLPGKNVKDFCGRPLIAWKIIQARACKGIDGVYVTTDSEEIAEVSREYGATVLMREHPGESWDVTGGGVPCCFAVLRIEKIRSFDAVMNLFPTAPLIKPGDFDRLIQNYIETAQPSSLHVEIKDAFISKKIDSRLCRSLIRDRTNDYLYHIGGSAIHPIEFFHNPTLDPITFVDWDNPETYAAPPVLIPTPAPGGYVLVERWQGYEIDYQEDFDLCEFFFRRYLLDKWETIYKKLPRGKRS